MCSMEELAAQDEADRRRIRLKNIADIEAAIERKQREGARTDALRRQLATLRATTNDWRNT